jgi:hypothetical protein
MVRLRRIVALPGRVLAPRRRDALGLGAAGLVWLAVLVLVSVAGKAVVIQRVDRAPVGTSAPQGEQVAGAPVDDLPAVSSPGFFSNLPTAPGVLTPFAPEDDLGISDPLKSTPPAPSFLPALPVIELPPLPKELDPLLRVVGPSVRQVCSTTGVVIVLSALLKGDLEASGIPVTQALTYLGPVLSACALFPQDQPSICAVDTALNNALIPKDLQILVGVPPLAALGLDQVNSVVRLLQSTGVPLPPDINASVAKALGCQLR